MTLAKTVDEMLMSLPSNELVIAKRLRDLVMECLPFATERPYYGMDVPYYSRHRQICFIFPASALCSKEDNSAAKEGVTLGFCQGNQMSNESGVLKAEGRKQVKVMYFHNLRDINEEQLRALLFEAGTIDDSFGIGKGRRKAKGQ